MILRLEFLGRDRFDRPVYKTDSRVIIRGKEIKTLVDVDPRSNREAELCTHSKDGEPDTPIREIKAFCDYDEYEFIPARDVWY